MMIPRGKYLGERVGDPPEDEAEHFVRCPDRVATLEEAKAQFQKSWDAWKAWAKLEETE